MPDRIRAVGGRVHSSAAPARWGFTLVELLVVVSIIALLISILLPSLKKAREQARTVQCLANQRSMGTGIQLYAQDHNSYLPGPLHPPVYRNTGGSVSGTSGWPAMPADTQRPWFLLYRLAPYFTAQYDTYLEYTDAVATCPSYMQKNPDENFKPGAPGLNPNAVGKFNPSHCRPYHFLINSWANTAPVFYFGWVNIGVTWTGYKNGLEQREEPYKLNSQLAPPSSKSYYRSKQLEFIKNTSAEWAVGDAWVDLKRVFISPTNRPTYLLGTWQSGTNTGIAGDSWYPLRNKPVHNGDRGCNLVFFDAHAETITGADTWPQKYPANLRDGLTRP